MGRVPTSRSVKTVMDTTKYVMIDPTTVNTEQDKWLKVWNEVFLK
jgi:hypothetical protein